MNWKTVGLVSMFAVLVFSLLLSMIFFNSSFEKVGSLERDCVDVNKITSLVYNLCYDAYTKSMFMDVKRGPDSYMLTELRISFFDSTSRNYVIRDIPGRDERRSYQISSVKNPENLDISLGIIKDFSSPICDEPRSVFVSYCPTRSGDEALNVKVNPLNGEGSESAIKVGEFSRGEASDVLSKNLVSKESAWKSRCSSKWECSSWEACYGGVQKRSCRDLNGCFIPTDSPEMNRNCGETCIESWSCEWSNCHGGFTVPTCVDENRCGTKDNLPKKLECGDSAFDCIPDIFCEEWSFCEVDYNFLDLSGGSILELSGAQSRLCYDRNSCIESKRELRACSSSVDVYTQEFTKCGITYQGVFNRLTNELVAQIRMGSEDNPSLDISLDGGSSEYCDYCFDGVIDGDEKGIDCGGSCISCVEKYGSSSIGASGGFVGNPTQNLIASLLNLDS